MYNKKYRKDKEDDDHEKESKSKNSKKSGKQLVSVYLFIYLFAIFCEELILQTFEQRFYYKLIVAKLTECSRSDS